MQTPIQFYAGYDLVVIGINSEMADYDNPRGEIIGWAAYVYAEDEKGYRLRLRLATGRQEAVMEHAEKLAERLTARLKNGKLPVGFSTWQPACPCYGSKAYVESGQGEQDAYMDQFED